MAKLSAIKTSPPSTSPSNPRSTRNRVKESAQDCSSSIAPRPSILIGPPSTGKTHLSLALGVPRRRKAGRSAYFSSLADIVASPARQGRTRGRPPREDPLFSPLRPAHCRRNRLPPGHSGGGNLFFQLGQRLVSKGAAILTSNHCGFGRVGRHLRRSRRRHRAPRPPSASCRRAVNRGVRAIAYASTPIPCPRPATSGPKPTSRPCLSRVHTKNVAEGRPRPLEASFNPTADPPRPPNWGTLRRHFRGRSAAPLTVPDRPSRLDPYADKLSHMLRQEAGKSRKQKRTVVLNCIAAI